MKQRKLSALTLGILFTLLAIWPLKTSAQQFPQPPSWVYTLIGGSQLTDDCLVCDRAPITVPMRGSFRVNFSEMTPFSAKGAVEDVQFEAGASPGPVFKVRGKGVFSAAWEMGGWQSLNLELTIDDGYTNRLCLFTNLSQSSPRPWPNWAITAGQSNPTWVHQFTLQLNAAPFRELWFSTETNFTAGIWNCPDQRVSAGDVLCFPPRIVKRNQQLTASLGIQPFVPDLGLRDFDILPGGEIAYSIPQGVFSETLGQLSPGDLISDRGRILRTNADLLTAFEPQAASPDLALQAIHILDNGETFFSVSTNFFSARLGQTIHSADLLSDHGNIVATNQELLRRFGAGPLDEHARLTAVYVWPNGEIWFALDRAFTGTNSESYSPGDLLSDQGYVVLRNRQLLSGFEPLEDVSGFGLDGLYLVTDVRGLTRPLGTRLIAPQRTNQPPHSFTLQWQGDSRVVQLEKGISPQGPFTPVTPMMTDSLYVDQNAMTNQPVGFYRLRQW